MYRKKRMQRNERHASETTQQDTNRETNANEDWVPIKFPDNLEEMLDAFANCTEERIGWCLMCNRAIRTEADLIPNTNTHNCAAGRALEAKIADQARQDR
jgi:hypothetical protein